MSVDGTWNIIVNSPMGAQPSALTLTADGAALFRGRDPAKWTPVRRSAFALAGAIRRN